MEQQTAGAGQAGRAEQVEAEHDREPRPRIYIASPAPYGTGDLRGAWIDADQSPDELQRDINTRLGRFGVNAARAWAIHDHEGFAGFELAEHESLEVVSALARGITEHGPAFVAYLSWAGTDEDALRAFDHCYMGQWPSLDAYAREVAEDLGWAAELRKLPADVQPYVYIDYDQVASFIACTLNVVQGNGCIYVFSEE